MSSRILDYSKWKKIHESKQISEGLFWDVTETEPIGGTNHKVKVKYVDANSIKVKAVNDRDLVGENGTVSQDLMDNIVTFLNNHDRTDFARTYPALQNMPTFYKDNFFTANVKKENDRRQVVVFSIQKRSNFKGVAPETKILSDDAAAKLAQAPDAQKVLANSDKSLLQNTAQTDTQAGGAFKLESPIAIADVANYTADSPFFKMFDDAVATMATSKLFTDKRATDLINKAADELEAKKIGENSIKLIKGLMAGFGATTFVDKYGRTKEQTQINQDFINKIAALVPKAPTAQNSSRNYYLGLNGRAIYEQAATQTAVTLPANFKMEEFIKAISVGELTTGDIKLPEGGIKKSSVAKGDAELKKVQQLIIDKLGAVLAKDPIFIKFKGYGADGDYGTTTEKIVAMAKAGFELNDTDGTTITAELINKLLTDKITESYIGLDGKLFEKFNVQAATKASSSYTPTKSTKKDATKKDSTSDRQNNINKVYCSVQDGIIKLEGSVTKDTKWSDYVAKHTVTSAEIEAAKKSCSDKKITTEKAVIVDDATLQTAVDELVDDLDGIVTESNLNSIYNIIIKIRYAVATDDTDPDNPVQVNALKRLMDLYALDESGDNLISDVEGVGTTTLSPSAIKTKQQIVTILKKASA
jgi:hypothetical protein